MKRKLDSSLRGNSKHSGAISGSDMFGHLNVDLSTVPQKTLLAVGSDLGKSRAGQQATQINQAIGHTVARMHNAITNPQVLRDLWNGNVTLDLGDIHAIAESDTKELEASSYYWLGKLRDTNEYRDKVNSRMLDGVPVATLKSLYQSVVGTTDGGEYGLGPLQKDEQQRGKSRPGDPLEKTKERMGDEGGQPFRGVPFRPDVPEGDEMKDEEMKEEGMGLYRQQQETERMNKKYGIKSKYSEELLPFLPIVGASVLADTRQEKQEKSLNDALFSNIIRDASTGDPNINPLAMGLVIEEAIRFNGDNMIFDPVFPGGSLNIGALPATTERLMIEPAVLDDYVKRCISHRNMRKRMTSVNDYRRGQEKLAMSVMPTQMADPQWVNNNKSVADFQHSSSAFNTMPLSTDMWINRRQIDGDVPLQDNLLPAQGLFISEQPFCGKKLVSAPISAQSRRNITYNPSMRFGWNYGVPFQ